MNNKARALDIYLMGIGGTAMGAFAGLLKQAGHHVRGSDSAVYSPMKEKLMEWGLDYKTPYSPKNIGKNPDLVIVGNVIRKDNEEAQAMLHSNLPYDSFPSALKKLFLKDAHSLVASGTHGKTTCSALLAHTLFCAGKNPGFLVGGVPLNFGESFRVPGILKNEKCPFVIEGDEYDTAFFDKRPKFVHYQPNYLLITSIEFDHGDIYQDIDAIIRVFRDLVASLSDDDVLVVNAEDKNIAKILASDICRAKITTYAGIGHLQAKDVVFSSTGTRFSVEMHGKNLGDISIPLYGRHNLKNALGVYGILHAYGLSHDEIAAGFSSFSGVKRRLEEKINKNGVLLVDDFAHHPSAVAETILACRQKYPSAKIWTIFEPRSATTCTNIFAEKYEQAFLTADRVFLAPVGRKLAEGDRLDTMRIARYLNSRGVLAQSFATYQELEPMLTNVKPGVVLLFMSNGDFGGMLERIEQKIFGQENK